MRWVGEVGRVVGGNSVRWVGEVGRVMGGGVVGDGQCEVGGTL